MPGPIVHLVVAQQLSRQLMRSGGEGYAAVLDADRCSPYTGFGSMGPDFLFFSLKEYGTPLDEMVNFVFGVYDAFEPLIDFYEDNIEPVVDAVDDAIAAVDEVLFKGLFQQISATAEAVQTTALTAVAAGIASHVDLFYPFYPKIQEGASEDDWYWFDFLHYRRTGAFASEMWRLAGADEDLQRYVLGYASHIATDVVGHPFVNAVTGGPYRVHWHRHKLVENWIDAYARNAYPDSARTKECLRLGGDDTYLASAISGSYYHRLTEFPDDRLPPKLAEMFAEAMRRTYGNMNHHPTWMDADDVDSSYRLWQLWFKRSTSIGDAVKPKPVPPPGSATGALVGDLVDGLPPFPGASGSSGDFDIGDILEAIFDFAKWVGETVVYVAEWAVEHAAEILELPVTEAIGLVKWLLYLIQKGIFEIYDNLRFDLVLGGYLFPEPRDLAKAPWGKALVNSAYAHLSGGPPASFDKYPLTQEEHGPVGTTEHHLSYPDTPQEGPGGGRNQGPAAEPAPIPFHGAYPPAFISQSHPYDSEIEDLYACDKPYGEDSSATHHVDSKTWHTAQFGSAMSFSARLITDKLEALPNFNLDGDRGYGWKTWAAENAKTIEPDKLVLAEYTDP